MKWSFATVGIILLGLIGISIILLFQQITTNNENDYYLLKEVTEAAMIDSIDISYYRETGDLKIIKEKFIENFTRRFAESTIFVTNDYNIDFYDIMETPPKVSIIVNTGLGEYNVGGNIDEYGIANKLDAILEYTGKYTDVTSGSSYYGNPYVTKNIVSDYYAILLEGDNNEFSLKIPDKLIAPNIRNVKIENVDYVGVANSQGDLNQALLRNELSYNNISLDMSDYLQSIKDFSGKASNINIEYHNCADGQGDYKCDDVNKYYINIGGNISDKVIIKYKVTWSYEEYEFSD